MYFDGTGNRIMGEWKERGIKSDYGIIAWTITNMGGKRLRASKSRFGGKESTSDIDIKVETYDYVAKWIQEWEIFNHV